MTDSSSCLHGAKNGPVHGAKYIARVHKTKIINATKEMKGTYHRRWGGGYKGGMAEQEVPTCMGYGGGDEEACSLKPGTSRQVSF